jgi:hypothetical protein
MSGSAAKKSPSLATDMVTGYERLRCVLGQERAGQSVRTIAAVSERHPKRRIDEDHR